MSVFKCKMCGGTIEFQPGETVGICDSCGTKQTLPKLDSDRKANLYDRANHFRRNNEFDTAASIYEQILAEDNTDAESYWSLVLCRYGIEYVEDPATRKRVPTVNRAQFTSIFDDADYKSALEYADSYQRGIYEQEAASINEIQKGILAISQKEEPFDVFICYKETDPNGRRTPDSVLANDLYHQLTQEGFKVFFARITLEDKLGTAYEPYIFAALNSAKVMVVLGTKPEYFNAVWVKNEWSRYLALVKNSGGKKVLIPAYRDMDPYDLPEEFSHLQAQDMSKLGFMQDLIRGIKKIVGKDSPKQAAFAGAVPVAAASVAPLLKRAFMFLEDGEWDKADDFCEQVLNQDPENAQAYLGKLMASLRVSHQEDLKDCEEPFDSSNYFRKALRFADEQLSADLMGTVEYIKNRNQNARQQGIYDEAKAILDSEGKSETEYKKAESLFLSISSFKNSTSLAKDAADKAEIARKDAILTEAQTNMAQAHNYYPQYIKALSILQMIPGWKNADELISICQKRIEELKATEEEDRIAAERKAEADRIAAAAAAKKRKKTLSIVLPIVAVIAVFVVVLVTSIIPNSKYKRAEQLAQDGAFDDAIRTMSDLGEFKDASSRIKEFYYKKAEAALTQDDFDLVYDSFLNAGDYNDAESRLGEGYLNHASLLISSGQYEDAIQFIEGISKDYDWKNDKKKEAYYLLGKRYYENGQYEKAYNAFVKALPYMDSGVYSNNAAESEGDRFKELGDLISAVEWYKVASNIDKCREAMYSYVFLNKNKTDLKTADFLTNLKAVNYKDTASLYDELYGLSIRIVACNGYSDNWVRFNNWSDALAHATNTIHNERDVTEFYIKIDGGKPGANNHFTIHLEVYDNKSGWEDYSANYKKEVDIEQDGMHRSEIWDHSSRHRVSVYYNNELIAQTTVSVY